MLCYTMLYYIVVYYIIVFVLEDLQRLQRLADMRLGFAGGTEAGQHHWCD